MDAEEMLLRNEAQRAIARDELDTAREYDAHQPSVLASSAAQMLSSFLKVGLIYLSIALTFFLVMLLFELIYPFSAPPELLFSVALKSFVSLQTYTDFASSAANLFFGSLVDPLIPAWNNLIEYTFEPFVFVLMEAFALVL